MKYFRDDKKIVGNYFESDTVNKAGRILASVRGKTFFVQNIFSRALKLILNKKTAMNSTE
jgi:hypothetical protein